MDRSIRKVIYVNEIDHIIQLNKIPENESSSLILEIFENTQDEKKYILKDNIRTLEELKSKIKEKIKSQESVLAVLNIFSVTDDLNIPSELEKVLLNNSKLAFFVGAGISKLLGIPLWAELARHAINYLKERGDLNHAESVRLQNEKYTSRQIISIFHERVKDINELKGFYDKYFKKSEGSEKANPYELLFELEKVIAKSVLKISTNIDLEWEDVLRRKADVQKKDEDPQGKTVSVSLCYVDTIDSRFNQDQELRGDILYRIHGSVSAPDKAILTTEQYVNSYRDEKGLKGFLEKVFKDYIVLFIGSGIQEFEILEHCLKQSHCKHFALVGTRLGEENLFRLKKIYFSRININALPYYLDFQDHDRLLLMLERWVAQIESLRKKLFYNNIKLIDEVLYDVK